MPLTTRIPPTRQGESNAGPTVRERGASWAPAVPGRADSEDRRHSPTIQLADPLAAGRMRLKVLTGDRS